MGSATVGVVSPFKKHKYLACCQSHLLLIFFNMTTTPTQSPESKETFCTVYVMGICCGNPLLLRAGVSLKLSATSSLLRQNIIRIFLLFFSAEYPYINYFVIHKTRAEATALFKEARAWCYDHFDPEAIGYHCAHTFDKYDEVATIARPPYEPLSKRPTADTTGYIVCMYRVFKGDDGQKFERNWLYWTGEFTASTIPTSNSIFIFCRSSNALQKPAPWCRPTEDHAAQVAQLEPGGCLLSARRMLALHGPHRGGRQPLADPAGENMRLHGDFPLRAELLTSASAGGLDFLENNKSWKTGSGEAATGGG